MMTNDELGRRIDVSPSMASRIRNGRRLPGTRTLGRIHVALGIPLDDLHRAYNEGPAAVGRIVSDVVDERVAA